MGWNLVRWLGGKHEWARFLEIANSVPHLDYLNSKRVQVKLILYSFKVKPFYYFFPFSALILATDGAAKIFFLPPYDPAGIRTHVSWVATLHRTFWRTLYQLSYCPANFSQVQLINLVELFVLVVFLSEQLLLLLGGERPHGHAEQVVVVRVPRVLLSIAVDVGIVVAAAAVVLALFQLRWKKRSLRTADRHETEMKEAPKELI